MTSPLSISLMSDGSLVMRFIVQFCGFHTDVHAVNISRRVKTSGIVAKIGNKRRQAISGASALAVCGSSGLSFLFAIFQSPDLQRVVLLQLIRQPAVRKVLKADRTGKTGNGGCSD